MSSPTNWAGTHNKPAVSKERIWKIIRHAICGLPLVGILVANLLTISTRTHQFLMLITLIWFQVFILFEIFLPGK
jgi:hypothetical protein